MKKKILSRVFSIFLKVKANYCLSLYFLVVFLGSCAPKVNTMVIKQEQTYLPTREVRVLKITELTPDSAIELGVVHVTDGGFTNHCQYEEVLDKAKAEARKLGGNVIKITKHTPPGFVSSCHQISAKILRYDKEEDLSAALKTDTDAIAQTPYDQEQNVMKPNRNIIAAGYQIGGLTLIGIEYEVRFHDYFGINLGCGLNGYTGGIKIHTREKKNSPFFLLSYKDGGFGLMNTGGAEFGGRWIWSKKADFGLLYQIGLAKILYIDPAFEERLFQGREAFPVILSIGIGLSW